MKLDQRRSRTAISRPGEQDAHDRSGKRNQVSGNRSCNAYFISARRVGMRERIRITAPAVPLRVGAANT